MHAVISSRIRKTSGKWLLTKSAGSMSSSSTMRVSWHLVSRPGTAATPCRNLSRLAEERSSFPALPELERFSSKKALSVRSRNLASFRFDSLISLKSMQLKRLKTAGSNGCRMSLTLLILAGSFGKLLSLALSSPSKLVANAANDAMGTCSVMRSSSSRRLRRLFVMLLLSGAGIVLKSVIPRQIPSSVSLIQLSASSRHTTICCLMICF
mmetsp:Transcript_19704/g.49048  ORF Transcript_19704/g.49048 Transcript_19704/m.49048 type:complete len:210 (-) Transcript_19704:336-965(-)